MASLTKKIIGEVFKSKDQVLVLPSPFTLYVFSIIGFVYDLVLPSPFLCMPSVNKLTKSFPWCFIFHDFTFFRVYF